MREELIFYSLNGNKLIFDVETTGLDAENNYIAQLSYIVVGSEGQIAKNFFFTVPKMEKGAENTHKLSMSKLEVLSQGKTFKNSADEILIDFKNSDLCIGHNVRFDLNFIKKEFERINIKINYLQEKVYCTMLEYTDILKLKNTKYKGYKWPRLEEVVDFLDMDQKKLLDLTRQIYNISSNNDFNGYHDSRFDVVCTSKIYFLKGEYDKKHGESDRIDVVSTVDVSMYDKLLNEKIEKQNCFNKEKNHKHKAKNRYTNSNLNNNKRNIFKDLFSFKGEMDSKKYSRYIWFVFILQIIFIEIARYDAHNNFKLETKYNDIFFVIALIVSILLLSQIPLTVKRLRSRRDPLWKTIFLFIPLLRYIFVLNLCTKKYAEDEVKCEEITLQEEKYKYRNKKWILRLTIISIIIIGIINFKEIGKYFYSEENQIINIVKNHDEDGLTIQEQIDSIISQEVSYGWSVEQVYDNTYFVYYEYDDDESLDNGTYIICYEYFQIDNEVTPIIGNLSNHYIELGYISKNSYRIIYDIPRYINL